MGNKSKINKDPLIISCQKMIFVGRLIYNKWILKESEMNITNFILKNFLLLLSVYFLNSCVSINQSLTPGTRIIKSDFDNSIDIVQKPVSASSSLSEAWHTLGFRWNSNAPDIVFVTAGTVGITNITGLSFNIDGEIVDVEPASTLTKYGDWSTRQFKMDLATFRKMASAKIVKMKIIMIDTYSVSSFGQSKPEAVVSGKFSEFLKSVSEQLNNK